MYQVFSHFSTIFTMQLKSACHSLRKHISLCPQLPKPLGIFAQLCRAWLPKALGTVTQDFGHPYPCTWVWKPVYVGMSVHGRGQNCSASARCLLGRGNRWHYVAIKTEVIATRKSLYTNRLTISVAIVALK